MLSGAGVQRSGTRRSRSIPILKQLLRVLGIPRFARNDKLHGFCQYMYRFVHKNVPEGTLFPQDEPSP